jgi:3-oxoacyl-[acyl-carrier-protein] synthase-1
MPIHVVGIGARTPLGLRAGPAAAALRAGISAIGRHPFLVDRAGDMVPAALDAQLDPTWLGPQRLLAMLASALREACAPLETVADPGGLTLLLALREARSGVDASEVATLCAGIAQLKGLPWCVSNVEVIAGGHAGGIVALARAAALLDAGAATACLVAGVDSYFQGETIERLDANRRLVGSTSRSGFIPAEGAGCCLLMGAATCEQSGLEPLLLLGDVGVGHERVTVESTDLCFGEALSATVGEAVCSLRVAAEKVNQVICDINGERYRGEEWGFVCLRLGAWFDNPAGYLSPADCWGDMGAASGPLFVMLACEAHLRGYASGPRTLVWAGSDGGARAAALLDAGIRPLKARRG